MTLEGKIHPKGMSQRVSMCSLQSSLQWQDPIQYKNTVAHKQPKYTITLYLIEKNQFCMDYSLSS